MRRIQQRPPLDEVNKQTGGLLAVGQILRALCLLPLFAVRVVLLLVFLIVLFAASSIMLRFRAWRHGHRYYLVCSRRHGWEPFLVNNLTPALPAGVLPIWLNQEDGLQRDYVPEVLIRSRGYGLNKPYLVEIKALSIRARSLHSQLLPFKEFAGRDKAVQERLAILLNDAVQS